MSRGTPSASSSPGKSSHRTSPQFHATRGSPHSANMANVRMREQEDEIADDEVLRGSPVRNATDWSAYSSDPPTYRRNSPAQKSLKTSWDELPKISKRVPQFQGGFNAKANAFSRKLDQILNDVNNRSSSQITRQIAPAPAQRYNSPALQAGYNPRGQSPARSITMSPDEMTRMSLPSKSVFVPGSPALGSGGNQGPQSGLSPTRAARNARVNEVLGLIDSVVLS